jgi:type III restriction enzyme
VSDFEAHRAYAGWTRCLVDFVVFDTLPELHAARALDASTDVRWWLRNNPVVFHIDTPVGAFEPDFLYERTKGSTRGILEVKGDFLWDGPNSKDRHKAQAACSWTEAVNAASTGPRWEFAVVIAEDVPDAPHIDALRAVARSRVPR